MSTDLDLGDAFVALYDALSKAGLNDQSQQSKDRLNTWFSRPAAGAQIDSVSEQLRDAGVIGPDILSQPPEVQFIALLGIDEALVHADPHRTDAAPMALRILRARYQDHNRFNSNARQGVVLPRRAYPARPASVPETLDLYLLNLRLTRRQIAGVAMTRPRPGDDFIVDLQADPELVVVSVPFLEQGDVDLVPHTVGNMRGYTGAMSSATDWHARITDTLEVLDTSGAHIGLIPELALDETRREIWLKILRDNPRPKGSRLQWILIGTGDHDCQPQPGAAAAQPGSAPVNRAVILDRVTSRVVLTQDKRSRFSLDAGQVANWPPATALAGPVADEHIRPGQRVAVLEFGAGRLAICICEDLGRGADNQLIASVGASHVLTPIFSPPIPLSGHWSSTSALSLATVAGCDVVAYTSHAVFMTTGPMSSQPGRVMTYVLVPADGGPASPPAAYPRAHVAVLRGSSRPPVLRTSRASLKWA